MGSANSIIKKVNAILNKVGPPDTLVYLRTATSVGSNALTGYPGTVTITDTLLSPQPFYTRMGRDRVPGPHTKPEDAIVGNGQVRVLDDWAFYISPDALTIDQIRDPSFLLVKKVKSVPAQFGSVGYNTGTETLTSDEAEVFRLIDMDPAMIYGADVLYTCFMRSSKRA